VADGELMGTSAPICLNIAHSACTILNNTAKAVQQNPRRPPPPSGSATSSLVTKFRWVYYDCEGANSQSCESFEKTGEMSLESMEDIITITIPILLTIPWIVSEVFETINIFAYTTDGEESTQYYTSAKFKAFFRMYTNTFEASKDSQGRYVSALSRGLMTRDKLLAGLEIAMRPESNIGWKHKMTPPDKSLIDPTGIAQAAREMDDWVFDEKAVIVQCPVYVWSVITGASILVIGGLGIGFTVSNRIAAVDPFNITTV